MKVLGSVVGSLMVLGILAAVLVPVLLTGVVVIAAVVGFVAYRAGRQGGRAPAPTPVVYGSTSSAAVQTRPPEHAMRVVEEYEVHRVVRYAPVAPPPQPPAARAARQADELTFVPDAWVELHGSAEEGGVGGPDVSER
ncbi:hypothetical protein P0W64_16460 [Tsukamurella sp. 8F]|uniref:hypothetical protein n=1 Tax=unclassified Tsukamurella TaxID=2633480 RepID=UPI0023B92F60|nr:MULTISPECIES: hypothetical protein [unclassified Tsukamurella]MDF0531128.1 hypothetical protein [Tsukamurella sp. 8J]MDF0588374.1 hypothetical protein [Tsukamurella sp. 8F]